jgi:Flp pilus assembly protein TadG
MAGKLLSLRRDERGTSIIEFAFVAPILALFVMGLVDLSRGVAARASLDQAAYRTLERVTIGGSAAAAQTDYSYLATEAATAAGVPVTNVTVDNWLECNGTRQTDYDSTCPTGQMSSRYVQITIRSSFTPTFSYGPLGRSFYQNVNGSVAITAVHAVRIA